MDIDNKKKTDIMYIHYLRVFAMLCVVMLHCITVYFTDANNFGKPFWFACDTINEITRKGVPLFFMISGYLSLNSKSTLNFKEFYKKRIPKLIIPFLVWDVIYYCYYATEDNFREFVSHLLWCGSACHLWFIYAIIMLYLVMPFFKVIVDKCTRKQLFWLFVLTVLTTTVRPTLNIVSPIYIQLIEEGAFGGYIGWCILGYILGTTDFTPKSRALIYVGGIVGFCIGVFGNYYNCLTSGFELIFNRDNLINHYLVASAVFVFFKSISWKETGMFARSVKYVSSLSFGIYFVHILVIEIYLKQPIVLRQSLYNGLKFVVVIVISTLLAALMEKTKYLKKLFM